MTLFVCSAELPAITSATTKPWFIVWVDGEKKVASCSGLLCVKSTAQRVMKTCQHNPISFASSLAPTCLIQCQTSSVWRSFQLNLEWLALSAGYCWDCVVKLFPMFIFSPFSVSAFEASTSIECVKTLHSFKLYFFPSSATPIASSHTRRLSHALCEREIQDKTIYRLKLFVCGRRWSEKDAQC